jgi:hypothetical protein
MSLLPSDPSSFVWGAVVGGAVAFLTGFLQKAGEETFSALSRKINPGPPDPVQVDGKFSPTKFAPVDCAWVLEVKLYEYEQRGYTYYPHPKNGGRCFRVTSDGHRPIKEFLVVQPGAKEIVGG